MKRLSKKTLTFMVLTAFLTALFLLMFTWGTDALRRVKAEMDFEKYNAEYSESLYYNQLTPDEQYLYCEICSQAEHYRSDFYPYTQVGKLQKDELDSLRRAIKAFCYEHPSCMWICPSITYRTKADGDVTEVTFLWENGEGYNAKKLEKHAENLADNILAFADGLSGKQAIQRVNDMICWNVSYDDAVDYSQDLRSVLYHRKTVCAGYAKLFQLCMNRMGYECYYVTGEVINDEGNREAHAWNLLVTDEGRFWVDVTWGDTDRYNRIGYTSFMVPVGENFAYHIVSDEWSYMG